MNFAMTNSRMTNATRTAPVLPTYAVYPAPFCGAASFVGPAPFCGSVVQTGNGPSPFCGPINYKGVSQ